MRIQVALKLRGMWVVTVDGEERGSYKFASSATMHAKVLAWDAMHERSRTVPYGRRETDSFQGPESCGIVWEVVLERKG